MLPGEKVRMCESARKFMVWLLKSNILPQLAQEKLLQGGDGDHQPKALSNSDRFSWNSTSQKSPKCIIQFYSRRWLKNLYTPTGLEGHTHTVFMLQKPSPGDSMQTSMQWRLDASIQSSLHVQCSCLVVPIFFPPSPHFCTPAQPTASTLGPGHFFPSKIYSFCLPAELCTMW